jgi:hypothetical protein
MAWHPDVPNLPIEKPREIEQLEQMDRAYLDSMQNTEIQEKIEQIAHAVARDYKKQKKKGSFDECLEVVSIALKITGSAIGGKMGTAMIAATEHASLVASHDAFPPNTREF